jgi:hypothetical protein
MRKLMLAFVSAAIAATIVAAGGYFSTTMPALAQVPSVPAPYNLSLGAVITNVLRTAGTANSTQQNNLAYGGVSCTYMQTAKSGTSSTTFSIQGYDAANNTYYTLATSGAITDNSVPTTVQVYPGAVATSVPTGMTIAGLHVPRLWRVSQTVAGEGGPAVTGFIGCDLLK